MLLLKSVDSSVFLRYNSNINNEFNILKRFTMHDIQHIKHYYSENREVRVCSFYQFHFPKDDGNMEIVPLELRNDLLKRNSSILPSMFEENIEQKLKEGEESGRIEFNTPLNTANGFSNFIVEANWEVEAGDEHSFDHFENFEYDTDIEVQIEVTIELKNEEDEESDDLDFLGAVNYMTLDIESAVEDGQKNGSFNNFNYNGIAYNLKWRII